MDEVQTSKYGFRWEKRKCVDCGKEFIAKSAKSVRCIDCRAIHTKQQQKKWAQANRYSELKPTKAKDPNICTKPKTCKYGGYAGSIPICDYLHITGHKRPCPAGDCVMFKRKARKKKT